MRNVMIFLVFILSLNAFAAKVESDAGENTKPLRVGFFIGSSKESFGSVDGGAITYDFACAISQKALNIAIVSDYVLKNLILRKYTKVDDPVLKKDRKDFDHILEKIDFNLADWDFYHVQDTQFFILLPHGYDNPIFNEEKWIGINIRSNPEYNGSGEDSFPIIPWIKGTPSIAKSLLSCEYLKHIPYAKNLGSKIINPEPADAVPHKEFDLIQLAWIFNPVEDYENLRLSQPFNIYMSGHGAYAPGKESGAIKIKEVSIVAGLQSNDMANVLLFFNDKIHTKSMRISTCGAGGKNLDLIQIKQDLLDETKKIPIRIKYLLIIESITDAPTTSDWRPEDTANINLKGYFDELEKFQYGYKDFVGKLSAIKAKISFLNSEIDKRQREIKKTGNNTAIEKEIKEFRAEIEILKSERKALDKSSGFKIVLSKISSPKNWYFRPLGLNSYPQIWIPEVGWYQTFNIVKITDARIIGNISNPIFKDVDIKTKKGIKKKVKALDHLEFDLHKPMEISKKTILLLYSEIIFVDLNIIPHITAGLSNALPKWLTKLYKYFPSIPCLDSACKDVSVKKDFCIYPQIISMQHGNSLNLFAKINLLPDPKNPLADTGILNFLRDSFLILRERKSSQVFFIKELEGPNDFIKILEPKDSLRQELGDIKKAPQQIKLQNIFIATSFSGGSTYIDISFEFNGKPWIFIKSKKDLDLLDKGPSADKPKNLWAFKLSNESGHEANLKRHGLTYLAKLAPAIYYTQLPTVRRLFKNQTTKTFQEFIIDLKPEEIVSAMKESPAITKAEWEYFEKQTNQSELHQKLSARTKLELGLEQQFRLQMNLKRLKTSLEMLKQKLEILRSKLEQLREHLTSTI